MQTSYGVYILWYRKGLWYHLKVWYPKRCIQSQFEIQNDFIHSDHICRVWLGPVLSELYNKVVGVPQ